MSAEQIRNGVVYLVGLILSICVHEFGHAFVADKLGDPLPRAQGRVTLNPIAHIDPVGTLLMPILMIIFPSVTLLGWGKPVMVSLSPRHMTRRFSIKVSHAFIAVAGPMMNVLFALFLSGIYVLLLRFADGNPASGFVAAIIVMNIALAFFNLIPCPPLDGGAILHGILPRQLEWITDSLKTYGFIILFALLYSGAIGKIMGPVISLADMWLDFSAERRVSETGDEEYRVELPEFEGPLDLLLHLVKKHELSILEIPIAFITEQYLKMLDLMRQLNLDVAGEYLLMAATLAHLKSRELVPPDPSEQAEADGAGDDDDLDPRQELIRRLLEYQKYKEAAYQLGERPVVGRNVWSRGSTAEDAAGLHVLPGGAPLAEVPVFKLIESLERVLSRAKVAFTHDVVVDRMSITDKINEMVDRLEREGTFTFESCFSFVEGGLAAEQVKYQVVVTFLAILEMTRLKLVRLTQAEAGEIYISQASENVKERAAEVITKTEDYK